MGTGTRATRSPGNASDRTTLTANTTSGTVCRSLAAGRGWYSATTPDAITGPVLGRPKSATFRTIDITGLDILGHVARNLAARLPADEARDFELLSENGWQLVDAAEATGSPACYQRFIRGSGAEFGVAKSGYVASRREVVHTPQSGKTLP